MPKLHKKPRGPAAVEVAVVRPADTALKSAWVAYAEALGVDTTGSKADLIARVG